MFEPTKSRRPTHNRALLLPTHSQNLTVRDGNILKDSSSSLNSFFFSLFVVLPLPLLLVCALLLLPLCALLPFSSLWSSTSSSSCSQSSLCSSSSLYLVVLLCCSSCCIWISEEMALLQQPFSLCLSPWCVMQTIRPTFDGTLFWLALFIHIFLISLGHLNFGFDWNNLTVHIPAATEIPREPFTNYCMFTNKKKNWND